MLTSPSRSAISATTTVLRSRRVVGDKPGAALARAAAGRWHHRVGLAGPRHLAASDVVTVLLQGEHFLRPPLRQVRDEGFEIAPRGSFKLGLIERRRPRADPT